MSISRRGAAILVAAIAFPGVPERVAADIFERDLGKDEAGNPVTGYVFQGGRRHRRSSSLIRRSRTPARSTHYRSSFRRSGYGYSYYYVPVFPIHCGGVRTIPFSYWQVPLHSHIHHSGGASFSVSIIR